VAIQSRLMAGHQVWCPAMARAEVPKRFLPRLLAIEGNAVHFTANW
jgi:hypothetical protein